MRPMNEIEIELPQIVLDRADAAYAQIRQPYSSPGVLRTATPVPE